MTKKGSQWTCLLLKTNLKCEIITNLQGAATSSHLPPFRVIIGHIIIIMLVYVDGL